MNNSKPYQDFKPYQDPHELLSLLAWVDAHDRLDILILEIRHIQTNLVHALRVPVLYRPLRFEERCRSGSATRTWAVCTPIGKTPSNSR